MCRVEMYKGQNYGVEPLNKATGNTVITIF